MRVARILWCCFYLLCVCARLTAQETVSSIHYQVSIADPVNHRFAVTLNYTDPGDTLVLKMPAWSPGGYFLSAHADRLVDFSVTDDKGKPVPWSKVGRNTWSILPKGVNPLIIQYQIAALRPFIDQPWVEENWALIGPTGMFLYSDKDLNHPVTVSLVPLPGWSTPAATGLDSVAGQSNTFYAPDFDILFDSPILMGNLEHLPPFYINKVPHYFIGRDFGKFDRVEFMAGVEKITKAGSRIIGDLPYTSYSYLSIGRGPGGIEHQNSTVVSFRTKNILATPESIFRNYKLLAHEYFHHYNVKRIRPIELGPFDYSGPNYTKQLWFAEGVTEYYAHLMLLRSGIAKPAAVNRSLQHIIRNYENKPGHLYQSLAEASFTVWDNSPFSKTSEHAGRTISYYDKGCIMGLLLDFNIRHRSGNTYSLDDVMRFLYKNYYQALHRGFTEAELQATCESFAGGSMAELFSYVYTTKAVDYPRYLGYAGLQIDTVLREGAYAGFTTGVQLDSFLVLNSVEKDGPAWNAGLRLGDTLVSVEGREPSQEVLNDILLALKPGMNLTVKARLGKGVQRITLKLGGQPMKMFTITEMNKKNALQEKIYRSWTRVE